MKLYIFLCYIGRFNIHKVLELTTNKWCARFAAVVVVVVVTSLNETVSLWIVIVGEISSILCFVWMAKPNRSVRQCESKKKMVFVGDGSKLYK